MSASDASKEMKMTQITEPDSPATSADPIGLVTNALEQLRFGAIQLTVHDGKVTQIDITERRRFLGA